MKKKKYVVATLYSDATMSIDYTGVHDSPDVIKELGESTAETMARDAYDVRAKLIVCELVPVYELSISFETKLKQVVLTKVRLPIKVIDEV